MPKAKKKIKPGAEFGSIHSITRRMVDLVDQFDLLIEELRKHDKPRKKRK